MRRRRAIRRGLLAFAVAGPPVLSVLAALSPLLDVDEIRVVGTKAALDTGIRRGDRMATLDLHSVRERIAKLSSVKSVVVRRDWPGTVVVEVVERQPAIGVEGGGKVAVYDAEGVEIARGVGVPPNTPLLRVPSGSPSPEVVAAAVTVVRALPAGVRADTAVIVATTVDDITLRLRSGRTVVWGSAERSAEKARILALLLPRGGTRFDLRSPDAPAVA